MPKPKKGPRLGSSPAHQKLLLSTLAAQLFVHEGIRTTEAKAKQLRPFAEKLITFAKRGDLAARREVLRDIPDRDVVAKLFHEIGPRFEERQGGYTRILKLGATAQGRRRPDGAGSSSSSARSSSASPAPTPACGVRRAHARVRRDRVPGWARQRDPSIRTIEGELTAHLERVLQEPVKLSVAGRTDAGVHARGQVASFRHGVLGRPDRVRRALNTALAPEVVVVRASRAPDGFDARFSAHARGVRLPHRRSTRRRPLHGPIHVASARASRGRSDAPGGRVPSWGARLRELLPASRGGSIDRRGISSVSRSHAAGTSSRSEPWPTRSSIRWSGPSSGRWWRWGRGSSTPAAMPGVLAARDRSAAGQLAPPHGLTLERVGYRRTPFRPLRNVTFDGARFRR